MKRFGSLIVGTLAFWALVALPARMLGSETALASSAAAALLCLLPAAITMAWADWLPPQTPTERLILVMGGTAVRLLGTVAGILITHAAAPELAQRMAFWIWVLVFYLFVLSAETYLLLSGPASLPRKHNQVGLSDG
jgi:hypothetical protein